MNNRTDKFSKKMMEISPSGIRKFFELCIGHDDIISLGVGEPDFSTPWVIREEAFYHPKKNMLIKALGCTEYIEPDITVKGFLEDDIILIFT